MVKNEEADKDKRSVPNFEKIKFPCNIRILNVNNEENI